MANDKKMDCAILGLLCHESLTGYEIKKRIDTTLKFFWSASYGSIYPTLNGLLRAEMVTKSEEKEGARRKLVYTITPSGRDHLKKWLQQPVEKDELRYETLLKLFFGGEVGVPTTLAHIANFEEKVRRDLPYLEAGVEELQGIQLEDEAHKHYMLTAMFGVKTYRSYLEWCAEARKILGGLEI